MDRKSTRGMYETRTLTDGPSSTETTTAWDGWDHGRVTGRKKNIDWRWGDSVGQRDCDAAIKEGLDATPPWLRDESWGSNFGGSGSLFALGLALVPWVGSGSMLLCRGLLPSKCSMVREKHRRRSGSQGTRVGGKGRRSWRGDETDEVVVTTVVVGGLSFHSPVGRSVGRPVGRWSAVGSVWVLLYLM